MYSVVLMTALAAGSSAPASWFSCHGFCGGGCHGGCYGGCYGGCCGGCYGCYGCGGGCHGCYGSCSGCYGCNGCWGGCWGSCSGCSGCWGSCSGCSGCWGSCTGCYGGGYTIGTPVMASPGYTTPAASSTPAYQDAVPTTTTYPSDPRQGSSNATPVSTGSDRQASAKLLIDLPADAKLYVDGQLTTSTNENRAFTTPALQSGLTYYYDLKAEISRDGLTHTESKRVIVRSGDSIHMSFAQLEAKLKNSVITTTAGK